MARVNTGRVDYSLGAILKVAPNMSDVQRSAMKPIVDEIRKLEAGRKVTNNEINLYASAVLVLGQSLMRYAQGLGRPNSCDRDPACSEYATQLLQDAGLQTTPRTKQKFVPAKEEVVEEQVSVELTPEAEPLSTGDEWDEDAPEEVVEEKPPVKKKKTRTKARPRSKD